MTSLPSLLREGIMLLFCPTLEQPQAQVYAAPSPERPFKLSNPSFAIPKGPLDKGIAGRIQAKLMKLYSYSSLDHNSFAFFIGYSPIQILEGCPI